MRSRQGAATVASGLGLVACGVAGAVAWAGGLWGLLTGATLVAVWLCSLTWWTAVRSGGAPRPAAARRADADAMVLHALLDAAPTPLLGIEESVVRALNRAARRLFATDDRVLPLPAGLADPAVTHLRHEGRGWRIDRVAVAGGAAVAALIDIEREERAAKARAATEMIQVLGHELLNGLAPIASLAESGAAAVEASSIDLDLLREILRTLARRAEGLQRFTEAYRALARLPEPSLRPVRLREMADDLARLFAGRWPAVTLLVEADGQASWPLDRDQVSQALWALLQNAAEAASSARPAYALVTLRLSRSDAALLVEVEDNGRGMAPKERARIFRPFHTTKAEGTGIGLSLARQIVRAHGGHLTLLPSDNTTFRMHIPAFMGNGTP